MLHEGRKKERPRREFNHWLRECGVVWKNGKMNAAQARRELSDYYFMLEQVPKVYCEVTGGLLSKPNYFAHSVLGVYEENIEKERKSAAAVFGEDILDFAKNCRTLKEFKALVVNMAKEYISEAGDER